MHIIRNTNNQIRSCNNDHFLSSLPRVVKQRFSLQERCVTTRFLVNPQVKHSRDTSYAVIVSFTEKTCTIFTPPRNSAPVCITIGPDDTCAIMCRKGTDLCLTPLCSMSVQMQSGTTCRCYRKNQLPPGQTVLVSALVLRCEQRCLFCTALNVYEVVRV